MKRTQSTVLRGPRVERINHDRALEKLHTVDEVADLLQVPRSWIYQRTRRRGADRLPHIKLGKYIRFEEDAVLAWLDHQRTRT